MAVHLIDYVGKLIFLLAVIACIENTVGGTRRELHPARDFSRHTIVKPKIYHGREQRQILETKTEVRIEFKKYGQVQEHDCLNLITFTSHHNGEYIDHIQITLELNGEDMTLDLTLNKQLIPKGFFQKHQENGKYLIQKPTTEEINHCHYNGKVRSKPDSWVAISTCDGLSGVIYDGKEMHYIEKNNKITNSSPEVQHFIYKHSDMVKLKKSCGSVGDASDLELNHKGTDNRSFRYKRSSDNTVLIRGPYNADKVSKYVELVIVVDNRAFTEMSGSRRKVIDHCKNIVNIINGLYSPLDIFIALVGVVIWSEYDEVTLLPNSTNTLNSFLQYRKEKLNLEHPNDNAQLLTRFNFDDNVVGKGTVGLICTSKYSGGVNTDHSPVVGLVATTMAHEMGHNFGMSDDTVDCKCPNKRCIMAPTITNVAPTHWSSCSLNSLVLTFTQGMDYCLRNKPESLFSSPVCGNGFVEPGEQCDCGLPKYCENPCCNSTTCMLHSNASCATGECCDLNTCKHKNAGSLCRSADYECDLPEYCTGQSEYCPPDVYKMDTEECEDGNAFCYHGSCRTRTDQCKLLWGETGKSSDDLCYELNTRGNSNGNCGYNRSSQSYAKCYNENIFCGKLHCTHINIVNKRLEFGLEIAASSSYVYRIKKDKLVDCKSVIVDLGTNQMDPGMVPDGAKCGKGKMCVNQRCRDVLSLRKQGPSCEKNCSGNGWCNGKGHCHCNDGFAPPLCDSPGFGGSEDSGPSSDPNARQGVIVSMFIIFLGIIPILVVIAILIYYAKFRLNLSRKKSPSTTYVTGHLLDDPSLTNGATCLFNSRNVENFAQKVENYETELISTDIDELVRSNKNNKARPNIRTDKKSFTENGRGLLKSPTRWSPRNLTSFTFNTNVFTNNKQALTDSYDNLDNTGESKQKYTKKPQRISGIALKSPRRISLKSEQAISDSHENLVASEENKTYYTKKPPPIPHIALKSPGRMSFKNLKKFTYNTPTTDSSKINYSHLIQNDVSEKAEKCNLVSTQSNPKVNVETVEKLSVKELARRLNNSKM